MFPGWAKKWPVLDCLSCQKWSPHERWYHCPAKVDSETANFALSDVGQVRGVERMQIVRLTQLDKYLYNLA